MKYVLLVMLLALCVSCEVRYSNSVKHENTKVNPDPRFEFRIIRDTYSSTTTIIKDTKTGIEYLHNDGHSSESIVRLGD